MKNDFRTIWCLVISLATTPVTVLFSQGHYGTVTYGENTPAEAVPEIENRFGTLMPGKMTDGNARIAARDAAFAITADAPYQLYVSVAEGRRDFFVTFNLEKKQSVQVQLIDMTGRLIASQSHRDVLNQTFPINTENHTSGIYVVRMRIGDSYYTERIIISP